MSTNSFITLGAASSVPQTLFGVVMIGLILGLNSLAIVKTFFFFRTFLVQHAHLAKFKSTLLFIICSQFLALTQLAIICIWALVLLMIGLFADWESSLRFSASCYTTLGIFAVVLPDGWHLIPTFIAFSGLFSFSWAATSTISMLGTLTHYLDSKNNPKVAS